MSSRLLLSTTILALALAAQVCHAQTFDFTAEEFVGKFNAQLAADAYDTIRCANADRTTTVCLFGDENFQGNVAVAKSKNRVNGNFSPKEVLAYQRLSGRVSRISIVGDKGDLINRMFLVGETADLVKTLDPAMKMDDALAELRKLRLLTGDDGPQSDILAAFAVTCTTSGSTVACVFTPRY